MIDDSMPSPNACPKCGPELTLFDSKGTLNRRNEALSSFIVGVKKGDICALRRASVVLI